MVVRPSQGFRRTRAGYNADDNSPKLVFVRPLQADAQAQLARALLDSRYQPQSLKMMLTANQMKLLPGFFTGLTDPRRTQGRIHLLPTVLAISTTAVLCGMRGYQAIAGWANAIGEQGQQTHIMSVISDMNPPSVTLKKSLS